MKPIVLASSSPRRRDILASVGIEFEVVPSNVEEKAKGTPITVARTLSRKKALSVWKVHKDKLVIGADTLVFLGNRVIGKPGNEQEAFETLSFLSGRWHKVVTAVSVIGRGVRVTLHDIARVKFRPLSEDEIKRYISTGEPMDKAGAYGVQGLGAVMVEEIRGNFYTVMGLPIHILYPLLKRFI